MSGISNETRHDHLTDLIEALDIDIAGADPEDYDMFVNQRSLAMRELAKLNDQMNPKFECPVCERKVTIVSDTICDQCFESGSRVMADF